MAVAANASIASAVPLDDRTTGSAVARSRVRPALAFPAADVDSPNFRRTGGVDVADGIGPRRRIARSLVHALIGGAGMHGVVGDRIIIESERVGLSARTGEILEVHESPLGADYRVRWDDGRVTEIRPKAGSARIEHVQKKAKH
jgi:hypothetical protein